MAEPFRREARERSALPDGYALDRADSDVLVLRRADGSFVAAFSSGGASSEGVREVVEADMRERAPRGLPPGGGVRVEEARLPTRPPTGSPYCLIARFVPEGAQVLVLERGGGGSALPVFGSREAAWELLRSYASGGGWEATQIGVGGLLSLLRGPCAGVGHVALDPSPEIVAEGATGLVSLPRQSFVDSLLARGRTWFEDRYREGGRTHG